MKKTLFISFTLLLLIACKEDQKRPVKEAEETVTESTKDSLAEIDITDKEPPKKSIQQIKEALHAKGFKTMEYVDDQSKDTVLMQQYFMVFIKNGAIRVQNEEEDAALQEAHVNHLKKMYAMGFADIIGPPVNDGEIRSITIYNVPTLKIADSLAKSDLMVKIGQLEVEIHPWWAIKGATLR